MGELEQRLGILKTDAVSKDDRIVKQQKQLDAFIAGMGMEEVMKQNRDLEKQMAELQKQVASSKSELSGYISEVSHVMYENALLRERAGVPQDMLLDLSEYKLKEKVSATKAKTMQKHLQKEVDELEEERTQLKVKLRRLASMAAEKAVILHD